MNHGPFNGTEIRDRLAAAKLVRDVRVLDETDSTNTHLLGLPDGEDVNGLVILAEHQATGRGRHGRSWACPRGAGILCTLGLAGRQRDIDANLLALTVPVALCDGIAAATDVHCEIKWPNDLVVGARKLGGVLIESRTVAGRPRCAVGFGINCLQHRGHFPAELRDQATSLDLESTGPIDRTSVLVGVLDALDRRLADPAARSPERICADWRQRAIGLGCRVKLTCAGQTLTGNLLDIDPTAAILVQLDEGGRRLFHAAGTSLRFA